jgi:hypothetical protein
MVSFYGSCSACGICRAARNAATRPPSQTPIDVSINPHGAAVAASRVDDFDNTNDSEDDDCELGEEDGEDEEDVEEGGYAELPAPLAADPS